MIEKTQKILTGYETTFVVRPEISEENLKILQKRLEQIVANYEGSVVLTEDWGKKKLAYPIKKEHRGHYIYFVYSGTKGVVHELERNLRLHEDVLRFLTVYLDQNFDANEFQKKRLNAREALKRREEEREARREERNAERKNYGYDRRQEHDTSDESFIKHLGLIEETDNG